MRGQVYNMLRNIWADERVGDRPWWISGGTAFVIGDFAQSNPNSGWCFQVPQRAGMRGNSLNDSYRAVQMMTSKSWLARNPRGDNYRPEDPVPNTVDET